jgi:hypothetical protein
MKLRRCEQNGADWDNGAKMGHCGKGQGAKRSKSIFLQVNIKFYHISSINKLRKSYVDSFSAMHAIISEL